MKMFNHKGRSYIVTISKQESNTYVCIDYDDGCSKEYELPFNDTDGPITLEQFMNSIIITIEEPFYDDENEII